MHTPIILDAIAFILNSLLG